MGIAHSTVKRGDLVVIKNNEVAKASPGTPAAELHHAAKIVGVVPSAILCRYLHADVTCWHSRLDIIWRLPVEDQALTSAGDDVADEEVL